MKKQKVPSDVTACLKAVRARISKEENWAKWVWARDKNGFHVYTDAPEACSWCLEGALFKEARALVVQKFSLGHDYKFTKLDEPYKAVELLIAQVKEFLLANVAIDVLTARVSRASLKLSPTATIPVPDTPLASSLRSK